MASEDNISVKLMKSTYYKEKIIKKKLIDFISNSKILSMGVKCNAFEKHFSSFLKRKHSILYNSGSSANLALIQAMLNLGNIKKNDKIAFSSLTWATNVMPLFQLGLQPIPVEVEVDSLNASSKCFLEALSHHKDIKAFFLTNTLGFCDDIDRILEICDKRDIILIEDNCESLGTQYKRKLLGNFGMASTSSFYVGHHLSAIEGGMVSTDDDDLADMLRIVRSHGWDRNISKEKQNKLRSENRIDEFYSRYTFYDLGYNLRATEITGFLGLEQLKYIDEIINTREKNFFQFYKASLTNKEIIKLRVNHIDKVSNFAFPLVFNSEKIFNKYKNHFIKNGIEIRPIVGGNITKQPFFKKYTKEKWSLKNSDIIHEKGFYCPNNPELDKNEIDKIIQLIKAC